MAYCAPRGIPHSHFLGGPNRWGPDDRDKALAWQLHELERCPSCGTRPAEWDPARGGDLHAYEAVTVHCRGCEVKAQGDEEFDRVRKQHRRGTELRLHRST